MFVLGLNETEGTTPTTSIRISSDQPLHFKAPSSLPCSLSSFSKTYTLNRSGFRIIKPDPGLFETIDDNWPIIDSRLFNYQIKNNPIPYNGNNNPFQHNGNNSPFYFNHSYLSFHSIYLIECYTYILNPNPMSNNVNLHIVYF